ncbi:toxin-activating lysine-acyltransferase [Altericroceibacterium endophyticum]|uniref:RTX toxin-activating lysine-acyltransferase n=1 Tax=Altericroceibacterium endophyticum TaxID=1808508 RepID=A0A6I4T6W7_9SPHN|nr:toxin-activating lysine-acyltransferase [Altericroceibacterium endophyticum]
MAVASTATTPAHTVSHVFGEITWLLSQSWQYHDLLVSDLMSLVMPAILNRQFHIFRKGDRPIGAALWAYLDEEAESKLERSLSEPKLELSPDDWKSGDRLWLITLIAPFTDPQNREAELMLADLIAGPFSGISFRMIHQDEANKKRAVLRVGAEAKRELVQKVAEGLENKGVRR